MAFSDNMRLSFTETNTNLVLHTEVVRLLFDFCFVNVYIITNSSEFFRNINVLNPYNNLIKITVILISQMRTCKPRAVSKLSKVIKQVNSGTEI